MINYNAILKDIVKKISEYFEENSIDCQVLIENQIVPDELLTYPRLIVGYNSFGEAEPVQSQIETHELIESSDPNFEYDYKSIINENVQVTFSFELFSNTRDYSVLSYVRNWIRIVGLGRTYLYNNGLAILQEPTAIQDLTTFLENDYEFRFAFDATYKIEDKVEIIYPTIEDIVINKTISGIPIFYQ